MFRAIGIVAVIAAVTLGVAHFTGHMKLSGEVDITDKGHAFVNSSIDGVQDLTNKGFDALRDSKDEVNGK